jgi:hypothetical protein
MTTEINETETPRQNDESSDVKVRERRDLDHIADRAAKRAEETERRYDGEHDIFTK